ncbi:hypothetical protein [Paractinoplanes durhamensis]|uniref:hypothetical protein n=1 Tax=Paractinoplanes durhamensis TaxID=113563 RepID=UPI00362F8C38
MVGRLRAAEDAAAEQESAPVPARPPVQSNQETVARLGAARTAATTSRRSAAWRATARWRNGWAPM